MPEFSRTWWGKRFLLALAMFTDPARLGRGATYARTGRVKEHTIVGGKVTAKVRGSINPYFGVYKEPTYTTTIAIKQYGEADWTKLIARIAANARCTVPAMTASHACNKAPTPSKAISKLASEIGVSP